MGKLAIRQGDVLFFARSFVWSITKMSSDNIKDLPEHVRMGEFYKLWEAHKRAGNFPVTQEEADRLAALCNVTAPRIKKPQAAPELAMEVEAEDHDVVFDPYAAADRAYARAYEVQDNIYGRGRRGN